MTGLDSIAMAVAHLESKDDERDKLPEETTSDGYIPSSVYSFAGTQPRLVSSDEAGSPPIIESNHVKYFSVKMNVGTSEDARNLAADHGRADYTTNEETCHDTTSGPQRMTRVHHNFQNHSAMQLKQPYRPIALDLTAPPEATQIAMMGLNGGSVHHNHLGLVGSVGLTSSEPGGENPRRMSNQISQKILLKYQSQDGAADDPIADLLSKISNITSDLPLLFRLIDELCEIGVAEHGPPAEVVPVTTPIEKIERCDVLSGRGGETNHHYGNVQYRRIVKACQPAYLVAKRRDKPQVAAAIVRVIRSRSGRFLKKDPKDNMWREVGNSKAREKSSQALREGAPELRSLVQLPEPASSPQQVDEDATPTPSAQTKLTPAAFMYVNDSMGQPLLRNVDSHLLSAMSRSTPILQYGSLTGPGGRPQSMGAPWPTNASNGNSAGFQTLAGQTQDIYQQAIQYHQLCGNKRPAPSETSVDGGKKRANAKDDNSPPVDVPV